MRRNALPRLVFWTVVAFVLFSIVMLVSTQVFSAWDVDRNARAQSEQVVDRGVKFYARELAHKATPQTYWDEAVLNLDHDFDPRWAATYIGNYFWQTGDFEGVMIIDADNRRRFASDHGDTMGNHMADVMETAALPLVRRLRHMESIQNPLPRPIPLGARVEKLFVESPVRIGNDLYLMSASLVQPDERIFPKGTKAPIVILAKQVDAAFLSEIAQRFGLKNASLHTGAGETPAGRAMSQFLDPRGQQVGWIEWDSPAPGIDLLWKTAPALLAFAIILMLATWWTWRRGQSLASSLVESEAQANRLAYQDSLTNLPNRTHLDREFAKRIARLAQDGKAFAVHCIDLDMFKSVNDSLGHLAGDDLIREVGDRLGGLCREGDFIARFGGDEFVVLQENARRARAGRLAKRIVAALSEPVQLEAGRVMVGASVGIVVAGDPDVAPEEYLRRADLALYRAKDMGRSTHAFFDTSLDSDLIGRQQVRTHLHDALLQGDLKLKYQPQVDRDGRMVGIEALARWTHRDLGEVPASEFVEVAEESGLIDSLGQFTIRQAFADSFRWPGVMVAVNVSAMQLRQRDFPEWLKSVADEYAVDPRRIELEITERILIGDDQQTHQLLAKLRRYGFRIVLDDFGTGYSSLGYLQRYPIDKVKIDRSFVARIGVERGAEAVVVAIVRLAKALGLDVVAEGVETDAQRLCLSVAGCAVVQGYLTGRPVDADDVIESVGKQNGKIDAA